MKEIKLNQLRENFRASESENFSEYVRIESENDPTFFSWLFDDENLESYSDLSLEQSNEFDELLESIAEEEAKGLYEGDKVIFDY